MEDRDREVSVSEPDLDLEDLEAQEQTSMSGSKMEYGAFKKHSSSKSSATKEVTVSALKPDPDLRDLDLEA